MTLPRPPSRPATPQPDVVIVGAGISGMLSAWYLVGEGLAVTVLDQGEPGRESSWAGGGILSPLFPWRYAEPVNRLSAWSQPRYPALVEELLARTGIDPQYRPSGLLMPGLDEAEARDGLAWAETHAATLQDIDAQQALAVQPGLSLPPGHHLWMPEVGQVRNPRLLQALRAALEAEGVRVLGNTPVREVLSTAGRVRGLRLDAGELACEKVVLCAGAWTDQILGHQPAGVRPVRGQMLLFQADPALLTRILLTDDVYLIPRKDGKVLAGSTMEDVGFDKSTTTEARERLYAAATALLPALADCPVVHHWSGLRPGRAAGIPCISAHPGIAGLYLNAGQFRNGVVTGLASARLLADLLLERAPILDAVPYRLD